MRPPWFRHPDIYGTMMTHKPQETPNGWIESCVMQRVCMRLCLFVSCVSFMSLFLYCMQKESQNLAQGL